MPELDFSQFHDLMHTVGSRVCRAQYGGIRRHIALWWEYQFDYKPMDIISRLLCRAGHHDWQDWSYINTRNKAVAYIACRWCGQEDSK